MFQHCKPTAVDFIIGFQFFLKFKFSNLIIQVALNQELQELNRAMAIKASVVQAILANNKDMLESHKNLRENEEKIAHLEKERDELLQQLKQTKVRNLFYFLWHRVGIPCSSCGNSLAYHISRLRKISYNTIK